MSSSDSPPSRNFVIQKHDARTLHYDFRLEKDGVLKSWVIPKGIPVEIGVRRLALETEDHSLDFGDFEGEIPEGEYGFQESVSRDITNSFALIAGASGLG